jgi:hypothetical protein
VPEHERSTWVVSPGSDDCPTGTDVLGGPGTSDRESGTPSGAAEPVSTAAAMAAPASTACSFATVVHRPTAAPPAGRNG